MPRPSTGRRPLILVASLTLLIAALVLCVDRGLGGDMYMDLFTGRFIAEHGMVSHDPFPTAAQGQEWLNQQWLSQLLFFWAGWAVGLTGISIVYALLLAIPLGLLLWACRRKGPWMLLAIAALYFPGMLAVIHPRAAGFTVMAFSLLVILILAVWRVPLRDGGLGAQPRLALAAIAALFAVWANLHGGFVAGLLLIALVSVGLAVDRFRGLSGVVASHRVGLLALAGVLGATIASLATPLGAQIWAYFQSFSNPAIRFASTEWQSALQSVPAMGYLGVCALFAAWLWWRSPRPRQIAPLLVALGFVAFAGFSMRNMIFVAPALAFQVAWAAPNRAEQRLRAPIAIAATAAIGAVLTWAAVLGPAQAQPQLRAPAVEYAIDHPPKTGRIATYAGTASYMLWREPDTPVAIDGRLEHYTEGQLHDNYAIVRGLQADLTIPLEALDVTAAIVHVPCAIEILEAHGFVVELTAPDGTYLVRRGECCGAD
ncbi:MAG: hypothetical protein ACRDK5_05305 [Solirubrobacterales bacterium]